MRNRLIPLFLCFLGGSLVLSGDVSRWKRKTLAFIPFHSKITLINNEAAEITVKVFDQESFLGSGVILRRDSSKYLVVTNQHVLRTGLSPYRIQTPDGSFHVARIVDSSDVNNMDLALLSFTSKSQKYRIPALVTPTQIQEGDSVFAAGFPAEIVNSNEFELDSQSGFTFTRGKVAVILDKPLKEGYQIGYTNNVQKGMSGGPLLDRQGRVVGINGKHAYPLWDAPELYEDDSQPCQPLQELISRSSLAIPAIKALVLLPKNKSSGTSVEDNPHNSLLFSTIASDNSSEKVEARRKSSEQHCQ